MPAMSSRCSTATMPKVVGTDSPTWWAAAGRAARRIGELPTPTSNPMTASPPIVQMNALMAARLATVCPDTAVTVVPPREIRAHLARLGETVSTCAFGNLLVVRRHGTLVLGPFSGGAQEEPSILSDLLCSTCGFARYRAVQDPFVGT